MTSLYMIEHAFLLFSFIRIANQTAVNDSFMKPIMRIQLSKGTKFFITLVTLKIRYSKMLLEMRVVVIVTHITIWAILATIQIIIVNTEVVCQLRLVC